MTEFTTRTNNRESRPIMEVEAREIRESSSVVIASIRVTDSHALR